MLKNIIKREILSGSPVIVYDNSRSDGHVDYERLSRTEESVIEEAVDYRIIKVTEYITWAEGQSNNDPSGSWGGGSGGERENTYCIKEWYSN